MTEPARPEDAWVHLQAAVREFFAAVRIALDVAEDLLSESLQWLGQPGRPSEPPPPVEKIEVLRREDGDGAGR